MRFRRHSEEDVEGSYEGAPMELLSNVRLFKNVDTKELTRIGSFFKERRFNAGEVIAQEGSIGIGFFVVESGTVRAWHGDREIAAGGPGTSFGEVALVDEGLRPATIRAESELKVWALTAWEFRPLAETNATVAWNLARIIAGYVRLVTNELDEELEN